MIKETEACMNEFNQSISRFAKIQTLHVPGTRYVYLYEVVRRKGVTNFLDGPNF
jgi:hypothetical protein